MQRSSSWVDCATIEYQLGAPYPSSWLSGPTADASGATDAQSELLGLSVGNYTVTARCQSRFNPLAYQPCTLKLGATAATAKSAASLTAMTVNSQCPGGTVGLKSDGAPGAFGTDLIGYCAATQTRSSSCSVGGTISLTRIRQDLANQSGANQWRHKCEPASGPQAPWSYASAAGTLTSLSNVACPNVPGAYTCYVERSSRSGAWEGTAYGDPKPLTVACPSVNPRWNAAYQTCGLCQVPSRLTAGSCGQTASSTPRRDYSSSTYVPSGSVCAQSFDNGDVNNRYSLTCTSSGAFTVTCPTGSTPNVTSLAPGAAAPSLPLCGSCQVPTGWNSGTCTSGSRSYSVPELSYAPLDAHCPNAVDTAAGTTYRYKCTSSGWALY
jgi:hypothetical protein